jgi:predicted phosphodiesterase
MMGEDALAFLRNLPLRRTLVADGRRLELLHAAPGDPLFEYLPASRLAEWRSAAAGVDADLILVGHTHLPVVLDLGGKRMVNPGSVGLPRDGDPRASYAVIEEGEPVLRRAPYDVEKTIADLRAWGLPDDVTRSLERLYRGGEPLTPFPTAPSP